MHSRRAYTRVSFSDPVRVHLPSRDTVVSTLASNLSRGGIFLRLDQPFPKGQTLSLEFSTFQGPVVIKKGEITWTKVRAPIESGGVSAVPGMGVRFVKISEEARQRIGHFVDEMIRRQQVRIEDKRTNYKAKSQPLTDIVEDRNEARRLSSAYIIVSRSAKNTTPRPVAEKATPVPTTPATPFPLTRLLLILNGAVSALIMAAVVVLLLSRPTNIPTSGEKLGIPAPAEPTAVAALAVETVSAVQTVPVPKDEAPRVGPPMFVETSGGWIVTVAASAPANIYHFTLDDPPRLVVLFQKTTYTGEQHRIEPQVPSIAGVRVQDQLGYTRFTFDFTGWTIPEHTVIKGADNAQIVFSMDISQ